MKLAMRCDDFGYSVGFNLGLKKVLEQGICTHVELMTDTPGNIDAMQILRGHPEVSVGWHMHWRGKPVLGAEAVPSMVDADGNFKWRQVWILDKKPDESVYDGVSYDEVAAELRAELDLCLRYMGRTVDLAQVRGDNVVARATRDVCAEFGIMVNCYNSMRPDGTCNHAQAPYGGVKLTLVNQPSHPVYLVRTSEDSYIRNCTYDPLGYMLRDDQHVLDLEEGMMAWHPGFFDDYMFTDATYFVNGDRKFFEPSPLMDVAALCAPELRAWIRANHVELASVTDCIHGTRRYQNYLRSIGSDLYIGSM